MHALARATVLATLGATAIAAPPSAVQAQSLLDRTDNVSGDWIGSTGTLYFNFVHRFSTSPAPERKVSNFPTFLIATGIADRALVGVNYATNSSLAARYPNEWEFFGRVAGLQQEDGAPVDLGAQLDYNLSVKGVDGEVSVARREGPVRVIGVGRLIADTLNGSKTRFSFGGGATLRLGRFVALSGDAAAMTNRASNEKVAWSAGVHVALPNTPHTLSIHVSNASTSTLQGLSRGGDTRRYGFEFTVPVHLARFFTEPGVPGAPTTGAEPAAPRDVVVTVDAPAPTRPAPADAPAPNPVPVTPAPTTNAPAPAPSPAPTSNPAPVTPARATPARATAQPRTLNARIKGQAFVPGRIEVDAGTTVVWKNLDAVVHTVTAVDKSFNSGIMSADQSYSHTFTKTGTHAIYCAAHPFMKATIVVK